MGGVVSWGEALKRAIRDPDQLLSVLELPEDLRDGARRAAEQFPLFAPLEFISRMRKRDPADPLLRQVLPVEAELMDAPGFVRDPVGDGPARLEPGLLQKYHGRALMVTTGACAIHCRYCFRRHYPYSESPRSVAEWQPAIERLASDPDLEEVLLSGGDPLTLVDDTLAELAARLAEIPQLQRLRVHTRLPIVIPQRVTEALIGWLRGTRLATLVVVHANHPAELDGPTSDALGRLVDAGIPVLNQAVLLRGVNDDPEVLAELSRRLVRLRVLPYNLNQLDRVAGAAHFEVDAQLGLQWIDQLRARLPGYAVPRFVQEVGGDPGKRLLA